MTSTFYFTLLAGIIAAAVTTSGIIVINKFSKWGKRNVTYFIAFAAGVLISVSFMYIIPKSFEMNESAPMFLLAGFLFLHLMNRFINVFVCTAKDGKACAFGIIPAVGIGLHSLIDGVIYSVTFNVSMLMGSLAAIGMILHEFPEGIVTFLFLTKSGFKKNKAAMYAFLAAAITTPLGVVISWPFISVLTKPFLGAMLSFSAGALVYVGATHLLPEIEKESKKYSILALFVGILVAVGIILSEA